METNNETRGSARVVITGVGMASPIGINYSDFSNNLLSGKNGFRKATPDDKSIGASEYVAKIDEANLKIIAAYLNVPYEMVIHNSSQNKSNQFVKKAELLLLWSCLKAFEDSKLNSTNFKTYDGGVFLGIDAQMDDFFHYYNFLKKEKSINSEITYEEFSTLIMEKIECIYPYSGSFHLIDHMLERLPFTGDIELLMEGCSSSNDCIGTAFRRIKNGQLKYALCGAVDLTIDPFYYAMFNSMNILSKPKSENECLVPYSSEHSGFTLAEGAGVVMLEEYDNALKRGAHIYGEVTGYFSNMANVHLTNCDPEGEISSLCIKGAIEDANLSTDEIEYVNSHGISTILDVSETKALKKVFADKAYNIPISSTKSIIGHSLLASGILECIAILCCFEHRMIHPTACLKKQKNECDLFYTPEVSIEKNIKNAISTSYAFLGYNSCIVLQNNNYNGRI